MSLHCSQRGRTEEDELRRKISCLQMEMEMEIDGDAERDGEGNVNADVAPVDTSGRSLSRSLELVRR